MNNRLLKLTALALMSVPMVSFAMPILNINASGRLAGASGVDVGGTFYDVEFLDSSCSFLFSGCNEASDLMFTNAFDALEASRALLDQVLLDVSFSQQFDSDVGLTSGCIRPPGYFGGCDVWTPYWNGGGFGVGMARNRANESSDRVYDFAAQFGPNTTTFSDYRVFAVWSETEMDVPEPGTLVLVLLGLLAMQSVRRRNAQ